MPGLGFDSQWQKDAAVTIWFLRPSALAANGYASLIAVEFLEQVRGGAAALRARSPAINGATPKATAETVYQMGDRSSDITEAQTRLALYRPGALAALANATLPVLSLTGSVD